MALRITVEGDGAERRLLVDGVVQSVAVAEGAPPAYWTAMLPLRRPARVLILGLGGGTLVQLLRRRFGPLAMTGVDNNAEILTLAQEQFGLDRRQIQIVCVDAFAFLHDCRERYDLVLVDLFSGETLPAVASSRSFQRRLLAVLQPGGRVIWNLHRDRRSAVLRRRLCRTLQKERIVLVGLNLVLHLRRRGHHLKTPGATPSVDSSRRRRPC